MRVHFPRAALILPLLAFPAGHSLGQTPGRDSKVELTGTASVFRLSYAQFEHWRPAVSFQARLYLSQRFHVQGACTAVRSERGYGPDSPIVADLWSPGISSGGDPGPESSDIGYCMAGVGLHHSFGAIKAFGGVGAGRFFYGTWGSWTRMFYGGTRIPVTRSLAGIVEVRGGHVRWPSRGYPWNYEVALGVSWIPARSDERIAP